MNYFGFGTLFILAISETAYLFDKITSQEYINNVAWCGVFALLAIAREIREARK